MVSLGRHRRNGEAGAVLVEFALVFPLLLLVVLGVMDFGLLFQRYEVLTNAAREGARVAILPGYTATDAETRATQYLVAGGLTASPTFPAMTSTQVAIGGSCMTVRTFSVSYPHTYLFLGGIVSYFGGSGFGSRTLTATSQMRAEAPAVPCAP